MTDIDKFIGYVSDLVNDEKTENCLISNIDTAKFDLNKAISLVPTDKADNGVTVLLFEAGFNDKTRKPYNASVFVGTPNAKDDSHIAESFGNV